MRYVSLSFLGLLTACGTQVFYYQDNVSRQQIPVDEGACIQQSLAQAPVDRVFYREPGEWRTKQTCDDTGCVTSQYFVPGLLKSYDANAGIRSRLERSCMAEKGYERLKFERCENNRAVDASVQTRLPAAANVACFVVDPQGRVAFIEK